MTTEGITRITPNDLALSLSELAVRIKDAHADRPFL
jgi:hypothetical protein